MIIGIIKHPINHSVANALTISLIDCVVPKTKLMRPKVKMKRFLGMRSVEAMEEEEGEGLQLTIVSMITGKSIAKAVDEKAPIREMNGPNI